MASNASRTHLGRRLVAAGVSRLGDMLQTPERSRSRGRSIGRQSGPNKRRLVSLSRSRSRSVSFRGRGSGGGMSGVNGRGLVLNKTSRKSKVTNQAKKKPPKPSKRFTDQVKEILIGDKIRGVQEEKRCGFLLHPSTADNLQQQYYFFNVGPGGTAFHPLHFQDAASCLFNYKTMTAVKTIGDVNNFNMLTLKFLVKNSYVKTEFRNNSQRTINLKVTTAKPKNAAGFSNIDPLNLWTDTLLKDQTTGLGTLPGINTQNVVRSYIGLSPAMLPGFKQFYEIEETVYELQPGQTCKYFLQGPKNFEFFGNKMYNGDDFAEIQKFTRYTWATTVMDLVGTDMGTAGRFKDGPGTFAGNGIIFENTYHYDICMPEQAGFVFRSAVIVPGETQTLNQRKGFAYAMKNYSDVQAGGIIRVDDENPVVVETPPT